MVYIKNLKKKLKIDAYVKSRWYLPLFDTSRYQVKDKFFIGTVKSFLNSAPFILNMKKKSNLRGLFLRIFTDPFYKVIPRGNIHEIIIQFRS